MADDTQTLREFIDNLLSDLSEERISIYDALSAASQYGYLRDALSAEHEVLGRAEIMGGADLVKAIESVMTRASERLSELPSFQSQLPDRALQEKEVRSMGELRKHAASRVTATTQQGLRGNKEKRRVFIHDLVSRFSSTMPAASEAVLSGPVDRALIAAAGSATQEQTRERFAELLVASSQITSLGLSRENTEHLKQDIRSVLNANDTYFSDAASQSKRAAAIMSALYEKTGVARPDVFVDVALHAPKEESAESVFTRADKLARLADSLEKRPDRTGGSLQFFSTSNARGIAKGLQQGADGILSLVGEPLREMVLHEKINGTLRSMLHNMETFTDRLGENFVRSSLFAHITQDLTKQMSERPRGGQARSVFDDVFSSVFRGPISPALSRATEGRILDYFELARANATAPNGKTFIPAGILPWDIFRIFSFGGRAAGGPGASLGKPRGAWLPGLGVANSLGNLVGNAFGALVDRSTSFILTNPFIPRQISGSRRAAALPTPITEDLPLLVALIVIGTLILMYILPGPQNIAQLSQSYKFGSIFTSLRRFSEQIAPPGGIGEVTTFRCEWTGESPVAPITTCPVHAPISQGPFDPSGSHKTLNAYDFAAGQRTPIVAAHDAYIASYVNSYAPNQYKYGSYGNNVVLVATDPSNNAQYCTNYAHMLDVSPLVVANSGKPVLVPAGTVIGYVDTTGYTYGANGPGTGTHLHWGYKGPNQTTPLRLPPGCP